MDFHDLDSDAIVPAVLKENRKAGSKEFSHARRQDGSADLTVSAFKAMDVVY